MTRSLLLLLTVVLFLVPAAPASPAVSKFSKAQVDKIEQDIQNSKKFSDKSSELSGNARENSRIATSNFEQTKVVGFRRAAGEFEEAEQKFRQAGKNFDDAWIETQNGLEHNDPGSIQNGNGDYNAGVQLYNGGVASLGQAHSTFKGALEEANTASQRRTVGTQSTNSKKITPVPQRPSSHPAPIPDTPSNAFPAAAVIVVLGTVMTSLQAFRDPRVYEKFILHPWSIVRHGKRHYTLLTNGLIHADAMHLMINLMSFCFFAFMLETIVGHRNFVVIYFGSLIFSSFVVTVKNGNKAYYRALGASGAIAGVIFSYILYRPNSKIMFMFAPVPVPVPVFAVGFLAYSYYMARKQYDNIGHDAHLWGAFSGVLITMILDPASMAIFRGHLNF
jgi:membrane associated rhomboid family serine protease